MEWAAQHALACLLEEMIISKMPTNCSYDSCCTVRAADLQCKPGNQLSLQQLHHLEAGVANW
jgi:hypothetical protein